MVDTPRSDLGGIDAAQAQNPESSSPLYERHLKMLRDESGISDAVIQSRGYWTASRKSELRNLGFTDPQRRVPALVIPIHNVHGEISSYQIRPDTPPDN